MYTVIRAYTIIPRTKEELIQDVQTRLVPLLNHVPGFQSYSLLDVGDNEVVVISTFNTLADAKASARLTGEWVADHAEICIQGYAKLTAGVERVHSESTDTDLRSDINS